MESGGHAGTGAEAGPEMVAAVAAARGGGGDFGGDRGGGFGDLLHDLRGDPQSPAGNLWRNAKWGEWLRGSEKGLRRLLPKLFTEFGWKVPENRGSGDFGESGERESVFTVKIQCEQLGRIYE